jgi:2-alkenal reductase
MRKLYSGKFILIVVVLSVISFACQFEPLSLTEVDQVLPNTETSSPLNTAEDPSTTIPISDPNPPISNPGEVNHFSQEDLLIEIYNRVSPGVVSIRVFTGVGDGQGSGFVIDNQGHIVTNYHVVEGAEEVEIDFASGYKTWGQVVGKDIDSDLAVIEVDVPSEELFPIPLGDASQIQVGQTVIAIGNPFGLYGTMTMGIVSSLGRTLDSLRQAPGAGGFFFTAGDLIQTDAAINPGNSGGPLLNLRGEVIGVNRAIRTESTNQTGAPLNSGIGFAVSVSLVQRVVPVLIAEGEFNYPYIGISSISELSLVQIEALELTQTTGVYVNDVAQGGPADEAGIRAGSRDTGYPGLLAGGDLIIAIDDVPVYQFGDLISYLFNNKSPGDTVLVTVIRDGQELELSVELSARP